MPLNTGQILNNRYRIVKLLGQGGFGAVYRAWDLNMNLPCAIKENFETAIESQRQFLREAQILRTIRHTNLPQVIDHFIIPGQGQYLVMDFIEGEDLQQMIDNQGGPLAEEQVLPWIVQICDALALLHSQNIIHRDIKPANIKITPQGQAVLVDFGIAKIYDPTMRTTSGARAVTPGFSPPEQYGSGMTDARSDIYALGATLYSCLTAAVPTESVQRTLNAPLTQPRILNPKITLNTQAAILKAMESLPDQRFRSATEFKTGLSAPAKTVAAVQPMQPMVVQPVIDVLVAPPVIIPQRRAFSWGKLLGGFLILAIIGAGAYFGLNYLNSNKSGKEATHTPTAEQEVVALIPNKTPLPSPTETLPAVVPVTATTAIILPPTPEPTFTPASQANQAPTETPTQPPPPPSETIGGADKVAFLSGRNVWVANLDGSELTQLTVDGSSKSYLRWAPDGQSTTYISGNCIKSVGLADKQVKDIACFNGVDYLEMFEVSPDASKVAISLDHYMYIVPLDYARLSQAKKRTDLTAMAECQDFAPFMRNMIRYIRWSKDGIQIAAVVIAPIDNIRKDVVQIFAVDRCIPNPKQKDNFPASRFSMKGYDKNPILTNFTWDGVFLFVLTDILRNDNFGDMYLYNAEKYKANPQINPIAGSCCYRDPQWSPDGTYLLFAFQDYRQGSSSVTRLYYVHYADIGTGAIFTPLLLPEITDPKEAPWAVLRPAIANP